MEFNLFIIPITMILVELLKSGGLLPNKYLPLTAVILGAAAGLLYGIYYGQDLFVHIFYGIVYGATASGIYDTAKSTISREV